MTSHRKSTADATVIGIDISKNTLHLIGQNRRGKIVMRVRLSRSQLMVGLVNAPRCLVGMEAGQRPTMSFVAVKSVEYCDLQALHRVRSRLVRLRTGSFNQIRGPVLKRGITIAQTTAPLRKALPQIPADSPSHLSPRMLRLIDPLSEELVGA